MNKAFSERRKMMRNSLQPMYSSADAEAALQRCGLRMDSRAQDLSVDQFVAFHWALHRALLGEDDHTGDREAEEGGGSKLPAANVVG